MDKPPFKGLGPALAFYFFLFTPVFSQETRELEDFINKVKQKNNLTILEGDSFFTINSTSTTNKIKEDIDYSENDWIKTRDSVEDGSFGKKFRTVEKTTKTAEEIKPEEPKPQLEFVDSGTSLSITGRKIISLNYSGKKYINEQTNSVRPKSTSAFDITQQMQIRMQGKVGEKINVNVDYDDTKVDKQDISVVYQGDPNEVVQNISFGDIDLSLPATEFVSYNKQLFGIRADIKTSRLKFTFVGSRTKGQTKTKQFIGNTQFQSLDILDTNYVRRKYYDITFSNKTRLPIKAGSEKIYIDRQTSEAVDGIIISSRTADDLGAGSSVYSGRFRLMSPGIDYVMDYVKGIVTFNSSLNPQDVIIIDYVNQNGTNLSVNSSTSALDSIGSGRFKLIKTANDIYISSTSANSEVGYNRELKTYYSIGQTNIVRDDGRGNFKLAVQDLNRVAVGSSLNPPQIYPNSITVDFEQGFFNLENPFASQTDSTVPDTQIYAPSPISKRIIHVEYYYRLKTFTLEPNIVLNSEVIKVDGRRLAKNEEYYIDYDSGFITFYYPDRIGSNSQIDIVYDVAPMAGSNNQSMLGARVSYDFSKFSLGSTVLYQGNVKSQTTPNISELASSMLVYEADAQLKNLSLLGIKTAIGAEIAQSKINPNLNDFAIVDNMEGIKQEDSASMDHTYWKIASNPSNVPSAANAISWTSYEINSKEINPYSATDAKQRVIELNYDLSVSSEISLVYPISTTGLDFSQKTAFEMIISGDSSNNLISVHLGQINEDSDGTGGQTLYCSGGSIIYNAPKTEDLNCDNQLSNSEDIGWTYAPSGLGSVKIGAQNGRIDSQDLNNNGRLDSQDFTGGSFGYVNSTFFKDNSDSNILKNAVNFTGWHTWIYNMNIASTETYKWSNIKQFRFSIKKGAGGATTGKIKIARLAAVGNNWNVTQSSQTDTMQVLAVNNIDNSDYSPIYNSGGDPAKLYNDLYGSVSKQKSDKNVDNISEQALEISYSAFYSTSTSNVFRRFTKTLDISNHKKLGFLLNNKTASSYDYFYIKFGDENNYYKAKIPLDFTGWRLYRIEQTDLNSDNLPDVWNNASAYSMDISTVGTPSLQQIYKIIAGVETSTENASGSFYLNEIYVSDPIEKTGTAKKLQGDFEITGFASFGGKYKFVDRNFQTPVSAITNQDNEQQTGYLNLSKPNFFPTSYTFSKQITQTPNTALTGNNNLVNFLQEGEVEKIDATASGNLNLPILPNISLNYAANRTNYDTQARDDTKDIYSAATTIKPALNLFIIPKNIDFNYSYTRFLVNYDSARLINPSGYYDTDERTDYYRGKLSFSPFFGTNINPGYTLTNTKEEKIPLINRTNSERYPKSINQTAEINGNITVFSWLNPSFNYSITTIENNNLTVSTITIGQSSAVFNTGDIKTINRTSQGSINLTLNFNQITPRNKAIRSFVISSSYQLQDGDVWNNVERDFNSRKYLWIRDDLKPKNTFASKNSQTIRDTYNSTQRYQPFEGYTFAGRLKTLSTLSISNNFNMTRQRSFTTGTVSKTMTKTLPDLIISLSQLELLTGTGKWASGAVLNLKHSVNLNQTYLVSKEISKTYGSDLRFRLMNFIDSSLSYNFRQGEKKDLKTDAITQKTTHHDASVQGTFDVKKFRFTPKLDYSSDYAEGTLKTVTQDVTQITPSLLIKTDIQTPRGLKLPFFKDTVIFTNRIIWTNTVSYTIKKSPITQMDNNRLLSLSSVADYEASKNLRISLNASIQRFWHKYLKQEEYLSYQAGTTVTLQF